MIVDSSALVAVLRKEADFEIYLAALAEVNASSLSAANYLEVGIVLDKESDPIAGRALDDFLRSANITVVSVTEVQARLARAAYRDFGKKSGSKAQLNFGDCFAYALAKDRAEPLLYKGNDFLHTDVQSALDRD